MPRFINKQSCSICGKEYRYRAWYWKHKARLDHYTAKERMWNRVWRRLKAKIERQVMFGSGRQSVQIKGIAHYLTESQ